MLVVAALIAWVAYHNGYSGAWSIGFAIATLVVMQIGYFIGVVWLIINENKRDA
jgi:biotin transporter BioY